MSKGAKPVLVLLEILALALGVPVVLFGLMLLLARFEAGMVQPGEQAAQVAEVLHSVDEPDEVERVTARMLAQVAPTAPPRQAAQEAGS
jgi:hypothetical protein